MSYKDFKNKSIDHNCNEAFYWLYTKFSTPIGYILAKTPILPNHVTAFMALLGFIGPFFFLSTRPLYLWIGIAIILFAKTLDMVDGQLARYKQIFSKKGYFLDWVGSHGMEILIIATITLGTYQKHPWLIYFGIACLFGYAMKELLVLRSILIFDRKEELKIVRKKLTFKRLIRKAILLEYFIEILPILVLIGHLEYYIILYGIEYNLLWIAKVIKEWKSN